MSIPQAPADLLPLEGESMWGKAQKPDYVIDAETGCWVWQKYLLNGYPIQNGKNSGRVHRLYFERAFGPIPPNHDIHHRCGNTACINPDHLEAAHARAHDIESFLLSKGRTFENIKHVRDDRATGMTFRAIAAKYGLSYSTVRRWCGQGLEAAWLEFTGGKVDMPQPVCLAVDCDKPVGDKFGPGVRRKFCSSGCRQRHNQRRYRAAAKTPESGEKQP